MEQVKLKQVSALTDDERRAEAWRIITIIQDDGLMAKMNDWEKCFVETQARGFAVSPNQLTKLRDIKDKYL